MVNLARHLSHKCQFIASQTNFTSEKVSSQNKIEGKWTPCVYINKQHFKKISVSNGVHLTVWDARWAVMVNTPPGIVWSEIVDLCETLLMMQRRCLCSAEGSFVLCHDLAACISSTPCCELCCWLCHNANGTQSQHQEADVVTCTARHSRFYCALAHYNLWARFSLEAKALSLDCKKSFSSWSELLSRYIEGNFKPGKVLL